VDSKDPKWRPSSTYVREKRRCVGARKESNGMVVIKLLCCRWLSPFFEPNLFPYKYPNNLIPVILPAYRTYEDGKERVFRNVGI
jgi:hypothetical protein